MRTTEALWEIFKATGHIGAYLLYKDFSFAESSMEGMLPHTEPEPLNSVSGD
ncbi:hypothetical protein [Phosphitispora sp. TUW77]|uniref:hypothetical protein n=1 Tax=Phosphitispora sp. TUW77 TaxID=3152361 RepID=UPI003AB7DF06